MAWTVTRRITVAFAVILTLLLVLTVLAIVALGTQERAYRTALDYERMVLEPALEVESTTGEAALELQRYLLTQREEFVAQQDSAVRLSRSVLQGLRDSAELPANRAGWMEVLALLDRWDAASRDVKEAARAGGQTDAVEIWEARALPLRLELGRAIEGEVERVRDQMQASVAEAETAADRMQWILLIGAFLALLVGIATAVLLNRAVAGPLREATGVLASSAAEILATTTQQASGASQTSAAVVETSTTVDEVTQTAEQATQRAQAVADSAQRAADISKRGNRAVEESVTTMAEVKDQVESIADSILVLAEQAQAIGEIITTVNDIAEQTNLLALNAAVEAARAGEHGRGFAVVAGEVRNLADESKKATVQVRQILGEIQRATSTAVMTTERGTKQAAAGAAQVEEAGETIRTLTEAITEAAHTAAQIVASAGQQAAGMVQIRQAMGNIHEATQQTLASTRQAEQTAQDLNRMGARLLELVGRDGRAPERVPAGA